MSLWRVRSDLFRIQWAFGVFGLVKEEDGSKVAWSGRWAIRVNEDPADLLCHIDEVEGPRQVTKEPTSQFPAGILYGVIISTADSTAGATRPFTRPLIITRNAERASVRRS